MKKKWKKRLRTCGVVLLALIVLLAGWQLLENRKLHAALLPEGTPYQAHQNFPEFVQEQIARNRAPLLVRPSDEELAGFYSRVIPTDLDGEEDRWTEQWANESRAIGRSVEAPEALTLEEAVDELVFLQSYMKYGWAHYTYYGGDEVFDALFADIEQQISGQAEGESISTSLYRELLRENLLAAAPDLHSRIDVMNITDQFPELQYRSFWSDEWTFQLEDESYFADVDGALYRLTEINGEDPAAYLKLSILANGSFGYVLWVHSNEYSALDEIVLTMAMTGPDSAGESVEAILLPVDAYSSEVPVQYEKTDAGAYTLIRNSTLHFAEIDNFKQEMSRDARNLPEDKPLVLDLRGHQGGNSLYAMGWLLDYLHVSQLQGLFIPMPLTYFELKTRTADTGWWSRRMYSDSNPTLRLRQEGGEQLHITNDRPVFVLMDRGTGSAGEWFINYLRRMDNVMLVGENSAGLLIGGSNYYTYLPTSRTAVSFSTILSVDTDLMDFEMAGYSPDVYLPPAAALERLEAMLDYYEISG